MTRISSIRRCCTVCFVSTTGVVSCRLTSGGGRTFGTMVVVVVAVHLTTVVAGALTGRVANGIRGDATDFFATVVFFVAMTAAGAEVLPFLSGSDDEGTGSTKGTLLLLFVMAKKTFSTSIVELLNYCVIIGIMKTG